MVCRNHGSVFEIQTMVDWTTCVKEAYTIIILVNNYYNGVRK